MSRHYTPADVAAVLGRYAPQRIRSLLEPAVGDGVLLHPLIHRFGADLEHVWCFDTDGTAIDRVRSSFGGILGDRLHLVNQDFLASTEHATSPPGDIQFDCAILNPPFAASTQDWLLVDQALEFPGVETRARFAPREIGFIARAIRLLAPGGRLLAVVPASLVSSERTRWFRESLRRCGAIQFVHELPPYTFRGVEGRFYLFVFEKGVAERDLVLLNHDLSAPERLVVPWQKVNPSLRLDYGYVAGMRWYTAIEEAHPDLGWKRMADIAEIFRGTAQSPAGVHTAVHTCDSKGGWWTSEGRLTRHGDWGQTSNKRRIRSGDLLIKRVGRGCSGSLGVTAGEEGKTCSDCIFILRPCQPRSHVRLMFAARVLLQSPAVRRILERGTGATYLTEDGLGSLRIPMGLAAQFPTAYRRFRSALSACHAGELDQIEKRVFAKMIVPVACT